MRVGLKQRPELRTARWPNQRKQRRQQEMSGRPVPLLAARAISIDRCNLIRWSVCTARTATLPPRSRVRAPGHAPPRPLPLSMPCHAQFNTYRPPARSGPHRSLAVYTNSASTTVTNLMPGCRTRPRGCAGLGAGLHPAARGLRVCLPAVAFGGLAGGLSEGLSGGRAGGLAVGFVFLMLHCM